MVRQGYIGMLRSFVTAQRDHVRREEESFFPAAERILDETDWARLDKEVPAIASCRSAAPSGRQIGDPP